MIDKKEIKKWYKIFEERRPSLHNNAILKLGKIIRDNKKITKKQFIEIMSFKMGNQNFARYFKNNSKKDLETIFNEDFFEDRYDKSKTLERLENLCTLDMISTKTASSFLSVIFPDQYGIIDKFSVAAIDSNMNIDNEGYWDYLKIVRDLSDKTGLSPKEVDLSLMTKGYYEINKEEHTIKLPVDFSILNSED